MFEVTSLLLFATVVTNQVYYASSQETGTTITWTTTSGYTEPPLNPQKVTLNNVTTKYSKMTPGCISGFDKEIEHKQNLGLITLSSKLSLRNCHLCQLHSMYVKETSSEYTIFFLEVTRGTVYLSDLYIRCYLEIHQMGSNWKSWITAASNEISANLRIVQTDDLSNVFIIFKPLHEPKLTFTSSNLEAWDAVSKYLIHDLTTYLTQVISQNLKTTVPSYLKEVAKEFTVETPLSSFGEKIPYYEHTTTATEVHAVSVNPSCLKLTFDDVINKYYFSAPSIKGFDKKFVHTQNFALINVTSELILQDCHLSGLNTMKKNDLYWAVHEFGFDMNQTTVNFFALVIDCNLKIRQMSSNIGSRFLAHSDSIRGYLTIVQNRDLDLVSIKFEVIDEPRIRLTMDNAEVLSFVNRYFSQDLTVYLTKVISDNFKTTVPSYLRKVAKSLCSL